MPSVRNPVFNRSVSSASLSQPSFTSSFTNREPKSKKIRQNVSRHEECFEQTCETVRKLKYASQSAPSLTNSPLDTINLLELVNNSRNQYKHLEEKKQLNNSRFDRVLHTTFLRPGSCFSGKQLYDCKGHEVSVHFKHVDLNQSYLNGYLTIKKLTKDNPEITTFFEAEIISEKHNFMSRRKTKSLHLHDEVDIFIWSKFPSWKKEIYPKVLEHLNATSFADFDNALQKHSNLYVHQNFLGQRYIYMRWKEIFLVPDATKFLKSASYDGLYYICLDQLTGLITGFYYHKKLEDQYLELLHVPNGGFSESFEFV